MTFDDITGDGRLWAVRYEGEDDNELYKLFDRWNDVVWLRNFFIITGGAIKLTATMQERKHTAEELVKIERTRRFLIDNGIVDENGFEDYLNEIEI
jgi:hypothetical protein